MESKMRRRRLSLLLAAAVAFSLMLLPVGANARVTDAKTPDRMNYGILKWEKSFGSGSGMNYQNAPTPPLVSRDHVYTFSGSTVYQMAPHDGSIEKTWSVAGTPLYATIPLTISKDGESIFGFTSTGRIFRIDVSGNEVKYADKAYLGQNINPLTYKNGYLYGGTWESTDNDGNTTDPGTYFCIDVKTMKTVWQFQDEGNGGYYWAGAYVTDDGNDTVFGSENGNVYVVDKNGNEKSRENRFTADSRIRCTIEGDSNGYLYFVSSKGYLYKMKLSGEGILTKADEPEFLGGPSVNTPVINGNKLYVAWGDDKEAGVNSFDISGSGLKRIDSASIPSAVKGEMLYSATSGCLYGGLYKGGSIYYLKVDENGKFTEKGNLFTPVHTQYGISPIDCDPDGNLYYKNDSGYIMCVRGGYDSAAPALSGVAAAGYKSIRIAWNKKQNIVSYQIRRSDGKEFTVSAGKTSYTDSSVVTGKKYSYSIRALLGENVYSAYSKSKSANTIPVKTKVKAKTGKKKIALKWKKSGGAKYYQVYRSTKKNRGFKKVKSLKSLKWTDKKAKSKKKYYYKVRSYTKVDEKKVYSKWSNVIGRKAR